MAEKKGFYWSSFTPLEMNANPWGYRGNFAYRRYKVSLFTVELLEKKGKPVHSLKKRPKKMVTWIENNQPLSFRTVFSRISTWRRTLLAWPELTAAPVGQFFSVGLRD